jgi:hypothetical protein
VLHQRGLFPRLIILHVPATTCICSNHIQCMDINHTMSCNRLSRRCLRWHNHCQEVLNQISARGVQNACTEHSHTYVGVAAVGRQAGRADVEGTLPRSHCPTLLGIAMTHPCCLAYVDPASRAPGFVVSLRKGSKKNRAQGGLLHLGQTLVPTSVETYAHLGSPIMRYLRTLRTLFPSAVWLSTLGSYLTNAHWELSGSCTGIKIKIVALARCCSTILRRGRCCLGQTLLF